MSRSRALTAVRVTFGCYLAVLGWLVFSPQPSDDSAFGWVRRTVAWLAGHGVPVTFPVAEAVGNVLLFVPFGLLAGVLATPRRWWVALVAGSATSAAIETVQLAIPGRWTTLQDWVLNTAGTAAGLVVLALVGQRGAARAGTGAGDDEGRALDQDPASSR